MSAKINTKKSKHDGLRAMSIIKREKEFPISCLLDASRYAFFTLKNDKLARIFFERIERPKLGIFSESYTIDLCFQYFQLLCIFNKNIDECDLIPTPDDEYLLPLVLLQRALLLLANISISQTITPLIFLREIKKCINVFQNIDTLPVRYSSKSGVISSRPRFFEMILETASDLGMEFVTEVANYFFNEETSNNFHPLTSLKLLYKLCDINFDKIFCRLHIKKLANSVFDTNKDPNTYLSHVDDFITCMVKLGEVEYAQTLLTNIVQNSFSIANRKDHQLEHWIKWLEKVNEEFPNEAEERIRFMLQCILLLKNAEEIYDAASLLIEAAYQWKPEASLRIVFSLAENSIIGLPRGLQVYFKMSAKDTSVNPKLLKILLCKFTSFEIINSAIPFSFISSPLEL
jgi:hypothetical protein